MMHIREIASALGISLGEAHKVFDEMCASGFRFSACTTAQLRREAKLTW